MSLLTRAAKMVLPRSVQQRLRSAIWSRTDVRYRRETGRSDFPPSDLRMRVHGGLNIPEFFEAGRNCTRDLLTAISHAGRDPRDFHAVLDFGCGCGRTLTFVRDKFPDALLWGTDIDAGAIAWCRQNLSFGIFSVNSPEPPLDYPDRQFDLLYAVSVFSHLDEPLQITWLEELGRIAIEGATLVLTVHGPSAAKDAPLTQAQRQEYSERGFLFNRDMYWAGQFPDFYQTAYHTREYVERAWPPCFKVLDYLEHGMDSVQDTVVLRKAQPS